MAINNKTDNIISKTSIIPKLKILLQYVFFNVYPQKKAVDKTPKNTEPENLILSTKFFLLELYLTVESSQ